MIVGLLIGIAMMVAALAILIIVGIIPIPDDEYDCVSCKRVFKSSEAIYIDTYDMGDKPSNHKACPTCESDIIFKRV